MHRPLLHGGCLYASWRARRAVRCTAAVHASRSCAGIQLIDRNDELCILYEKSNIQDDVLRNGHIEFRERTKELRWLRLIHADLLREIALTRKIVPRLDEYRREIREITEQLHAERLKADQLSYDLETPANKARWRALDGKDLEPDELATKVPALRATARGCRLMGGAGRSARGSLAHRVSHTVGAGARGAAERQEGADARERACAGGGLEPRGPAAQASGGRARRHARAREQGERVPVAHPQVRALTVSDAVSA